MLKTQPAAKNGFTLVELSIVLVIIGLLIGGTLIGQSLIKSAEINGYVKKLQQYQIATKLFREKFKQEAGDSNLFTPAGNNNKSSSDSLGCNGIYGGEEFFQAFSHLSQAAMLNANYAPYSPIGCGGTMEFAHNLAGIITPVFAVTDVYPQDEFDLFSPNTPKVPIFYYANIYRNIFSTMLDTAAAIAVDHKIDDGYNGTGNFIGWVSGPDQYCDDYMRNHSRDPNGLYCDVTYYPEGYNYN